MPRPKALVMETLDDEVLREAIIKKALETHEPYKVFKSPVRSQGWVLVHDRPRGKGRVLIMEGIENKRTANDLRAMLERAWAEGYTSSRED